MQQSSQSKSSTKGERRNEGLCKPLPLGLLFASLAVLLLVFTHDAIATRHASNHYPYNSSEPNVSMAMSLSLLLSHLSSNKA